jgi:hypothetical protein
MRSEPIDFIREPAATTSFRFAILSTIPYAHPPPKTLRRAILHYGAARFARSLVQPKCEGLKKTWVESHEVAKKLGQVEECAVYRRVLAASDSFDILLVKTMSHTAQHDY